MRRLRLLLSAWLVLVLLPSVTMAIAGAYNPTRVDDANVVAAAKFAVAEQKKKLQQMNESQPVHLNLVKILRARQQIVSGVNYELYLMVSQDGMEKEVRTIIWWQAWRKPESFRLMVWEDKEASTDD